MKTLLPLSLVAVLFTACPAPAKPDAGVDSGYAGSPRLLIKNACSYGIWIQQQGMPAGVASVSFLDAGASMAYSIPAVGLASTRFWPKKGCDATGQNCSMGQSSSPCPAGGCLPPVDSKLEATWGCTLADQKKCGKTPQGVLMTSTYWNSSAVDGFTFPYTVVLDGGDGRGGCLPVDCSALAMSSCPASDNLSNDGGNPQYSSVNLNVKLADGGSGGCFAPCMALNYPGFGGAGLNNPAGAVEQMYCCPTPPISSPQCRAGPVPQTKYVKAVHAQCKGTSYGYAYDDGIGGRNCSSPTVVSMTVGPNCP
jgi:hypothetical protein